jgi:hypothetical protein
MPDVGLDGNMKQPRSGDLASQKPTSHWQHASTSSLHGLAGG